MMKVVVAAFLATIGAVRGLNFLLLHPFYCGSHVLTLHTVTTELIAKGHKASI